jgi:hypothetical protein
MELTVFYPEKDRAGSIYITRIQTLVGHVSYLLTAAFVDVPNAIP